LERLETEIRANKSLPLIEANLVFGEGDENCDVMFIGEAPGFHEDKLGRPFVGRAGQLLDKLIGEIGWKRTDVYITNIVKRRPPENRDPFPEEIESYKPYLARQIEIIKPKVIATLGRFSMNYFLPLAKISHDHGRVFRKDPPSQSFGEASEMIIYPLYHPAAALRATAVLNDLRADFKKIPDVVAGILVAVTEEKNSVFTPQSPPTPKKSSTPQSKLF